jgi:hypothetical protein
VGLQGRSAKERKIPLPQPGFEPGAVEPVPSRYTSRAIPAHYCNSSLSIIIIIIIIQLIQRVPGFFPVEGGGGREKRPWLEVNYSPPSNADVKNEWSYTCTNPIRLHAVDRENFSCIIITEAQTRMFAHFV